MSIRSLGWTAVGALALGCGGGDRPAAGAGTSDSGASGGSIGGQATLILFFDTFTNEIYTKWFDAYAKATGVRINYQSIGSGGGIRQFTEGTVDFGATDGPMSDAQISALGGNVLHVPTVLGAVVVTYNLPELGATPLRFDGATLADVFLGRISKWNDSRLAALNPGVKLPAKDIIVVHRSDGSGTSFIFTDFLAKVSPTWKSKVGSATSVKWPTGLGGKGNEGVTQQVKQSDGAIGYVELIYAISNKLPYANVKNPEGQFVQPSLRSVTAAATAAELTPDTDFRVSVTNARGAEAYPISSFTWLLIQPQPRDSAKGAQIEAFIKWMLQPEAQRMAADLHYAPLPVPVIELVQKRLAS
ncbi:MAG: phosphate ABC transporter substrate-binding protein PstS [Gemmatimonadales bacterium]|nr:phosphate ABC transporter substrate-binding protein PstS [Gemmatimonadales bacterium]